MQTQHPPTGNNKTTFKLLHMKHKILQVFIFLSLLLGGGVSWGQTFYDMSTGNYSQDFSNISGWTDNYASGTGAGNWRTATSVATSTVNTATVFSTGTTGGVQKGTNSMILLATGTNSTATDLLLNFTGRNAGTISLNWVKVTNTVNVSPRSSDLKIQYSSDNGVTFTDLTGYTIPRVLNNSTPESGNLSAITLPAALNNQSQVVIRFYVWNNGQTGGSGNRPKIQIDDIAVTSTPATSTPTLTTPTATTITDVSATLGANITADGGSAITARGTSYKTSSPVIATDNLLAEGGTTTGVYSHSRTGLSPQTQYFYVGYATNSTGTGISSEGNFRTLSSAPTAQSSGVSASAASSTQINLSITAATFPSSGATQAGYVVIYSTGTPTLSSTNGQAPAAGVGTIFVTSATNLPSTPSTTVNVTGLTPATSYNFLVVPYTWDGTNASTYHYLTASAPTASTTTSSGAPTLSTPTVSAITHNSATLGATVTTDGGSALTARGTAYKTSSPVIAIDNQLAEGGTSVAAFNHSRTGLSPETQYFFVGYATNSSATAISSEGNFRTLSSPPTVQAGLSAAASSTTQINLTITAATFPASGATQAGYVVIYATGTPTFTASNGQAPAVGVGTIFATSATVLPSTPSTTVNVTGLTQSTLYNFLVIPYTWDGTNPETYNYLTASAPTANATTQSPITIAIQDFETSPSTPTWSYTGGGSINTTTNKFNGAASYRISSTQILTMDNVDISGYTNVQLSVAFAGDGPDSGEDLMMDISYDNGSTWNGTGSIMLVDGFSNTNLNINTTSSSGIITVSSNPWITSISPSETQIRVRFRITGSASTSEYYFIDDVKLTGIVNSSPIITLNPTSLTTFTQTSAAPSTEQSYTVSGNNLTNDVTITPPTGYEISTTTGGSFSATNPITLNVSGGDIVGEPVTIYVRQNSSTLGAVSGNITHTSTGANNPNVAVSGTRTGTYYSKSTGNLDDLATWGLNTDGTGTAPSNFTTDGVIYEIRNRAAATIGANWSVSGTASKVVVGDGTNATDFTIPSGFTLTGTIDVSDNAELTIENTTSPTLGTLAANSTLEYNNVAVTLSTSTAYSNLKLSGSGTKTFPGGTTTITGNLILDNCTLNGGSGPFSTITLAGNLNYMGTVTPPADANSITLSTNGTAAGTQTITGAGNTVRWFRITTTTVNTILLSTSGGSSDLSLGNLSGGGITLVDGSILNMNGNDMTLFNSTSTSSAFVLNSTGTISVNNSTDFTIQRSGNGNLGTLRFTSGANTIGNLTLNHTGATNNTLTIGNALNVTGTINIIDGTLSTGGFVTLKSDALNTARIAEIGSGGSISGNITIERHIPANGRRWRYLAAPFSSGPTIASSWQNQIHITGPGTGGTTCPTLTANSNGFDATLTNSASFMTFNETVATGPSFSNGFVTIPNTNATNLTAGRGYNVFVRGNKVTQACDLINGTNPAAQAVTLSATGTVQTGSFNFTGLTYNAANGEGWNLVGNPYPSNIDWNAASGWSKTDLDGSVYMYNPTNNTYASWNGSASTNGGSRYIPSGQSFFIKGSSASMALSCTEAVKVADNPGTILLKNKKVSTQISITMQSSTGLTDETVIALHNDFTDTYNGAAFDAEKLLNPSGLNVYSILPFGSKQMVFNGLAPVDVNESKIIPLGITSPVNGAHELNFTLEELPYYYEVYLIDSFLNTTTMLTETSKYPFTTTTNALSKGNNRFSLALYNKLPISTGIDNAMQQQHAVHVYPNPVNDMLQIGFTKKSSQPVVITIYNSIGKIVKNITLNDVQYGTETGINLSELPAGIYMVDVTGTQIKSTHKIVKN